jgi:phospholipase/carboxylesterase
MGRQWFDLSLGDMALIANGVKQAAPALQAFLDAELTQHNLPAEALALVGFSQGTMMALAVGLARTPSPAAIVGYSGALAAVEALPAPGSGPAILLVHGDKDEVIPVDAMLMAREALAQAGLPVEWHVAEGIGHGIDGDGLRMGGDFLKQAFAAAQASQGS